MIRKSAVALTLVAIFGLAAVPSGAQVRAATPPDLTSAYSNLADIIIGAKGAERHLVLAILDVTYRHAEVLVKQTKTAMAAGEEAHAQLETLAALVAQLGNEGDAAVAGIRKRLLEGGHHHNAAGEQQGIYEEGFVVVTRAAKRTFLACATEIGRLSAAPDADALDAQWEKVRTQYLALVGDETK